MPNQGWIYRDKISKNQAGLSLLAYYAGKYPHSSREEWLDRILSAAILVNGRPACPDKVLEIGQQLTYQRPPWTEPDVPLFFEVLYEDAEVLVVAKPSGLPVLAGGGFLEHTLIHLVHQHYGDVTPYPIHRLGRGTSGIVLMAKSKPARAKLSQQMREGKITKIYRALVGRGDIPDNFTINQAIGKIAHPILGYVYGALTDGLSARSDGRVLKKHPDSTLLEVQIFTGRPHQIRIHLAFFGYPLIGDPLYGLGGLPRPDAVPGDCGYYLHANQIVFNHPSTGERISICCPAPPELVISYQLSVISSLRKLPTPHTPHPTPHTPHPTPYTPHPTPCPQEKLFAADPI
ncbi:RluA family pseudouridine synthase [Microcystis sp.]|uniref:RluA family pseudouridine synthase n=1 Tax=Microcystis sp. TaxID=1127 RepID=UPI003AF6EA0E